MIDFMSSFNDMSKQEIKQKVPQSRT